MKLTVPDIGNFEGVEVIDVLVAEGDTVEVEQGLITIETDKAAMDVPSTHAGKITKLLVKAGDKVSQGSEIAELEPAEGAPAKQAEPAKPAETGERAKERLALEAGIEDDHRDANSVDSNRGAKSAAPTSAAPTGGGVPPHASPSVRKLARELGVDLTRVAGTGRKGRITHDDVKLFVKGVMQRGGAGAGPSFEPMPDIDFAQWGPVETEPLTRIQRIAGPHLQRAWATIPHVTQHDVADITDMETVRQSLKADAEEKYGAKLTPLAFIVKACALTLQEFPRFNSSLKGEQLVVKKYFHIGFAVDTPEGLVVPVIRDADQKNVFEIAKELGEIAGKARDKKLKATDMQGGTFSISSLGGIGGTAFTPIVNAPEVAILGVSRSSMQPVWDGTEFKPRLMLPLSLSYDHRVIDGAAAARFTTRLAQIMEKSEGLVL